jgi:hypothetical protein
LQDHEKIGVFDQAKLEDLERDPPDLGMINSDRCGSEVSDGVFRPPLLEFWTCLGQRGHDFRESRIVALTNRGSELTEHGTRGRLPTNHASAVLCVRKHHPD